MRTAAIVVLLAPLACADGAVNGVPAAPAANVGPAGRAALPARPGALPPRLPPPPRAEETLVVEHAEGEAAAKVVSLILELKDSVRATAYQARTEVDEKVGRYAWDCSGMADWILRRTAPKARRALRKSRPRAIDFYKAIAHAPKVKPRRGWQKLGHVADARPGDLFAFPKSPLSASKISGHVGFFVEQPWKVKSYADGHETWAARILDATGLPHQNDTRPRDSDGGFGFGTFLFVNDKDGETIGYGWFGTASRGYLPTTVAYGRVTR